jgi:hypothetical protein
LSIFKKFKPYEFDYDKIQRNVIDGLRLPFNFEKIDIYTKTINERNDSNIESFIVDLLTREDVNCAPSSDKTVMRKIVETRHGKLSAGFDIDN